MVTGLVLIRCQAGMEIEALGKIKEFVGVKELREVFGRWDGLATIQAENLSELASIVVEEIRPTRGVATTETLIVGRYE